ncbi:hypothetical protein ACEPAG_5640 [Sanghuangporus baumii]
MSVSLDDIWSEPLDSLQPPSARTSPGLHRVDDEDEEESVYRPAKRRRSSLFLEGSDDGNEEAPRKSPARKDQSRPDIDALFEDLEEPSERRSSRTSKPFDLASLRKDAQARAEKEAPKSSHPEYVVQSSSPPHKGIDGQRSAFATDEADGNKRRQLPKLDEERLLGKEGFSALIQACRDFKPKGKGHELADLNRLFSLYQFWAHKLYPKTQFSDTVNRIEKLCHSKRMHSALLGWRDEFHGTINGKKFSENEDIDMHSDNDVVSGDEERRRRDEEDVFGPRRENTAASLHASSSRASSVAPEPPISRPPSSASGSRGDVAMPDDDDPFDIDALLQQEEEMRREAAARANAPASTSVQTKRGDAGRDFTFDEDEEALWAELHDNAFENSPKPAILPDPAATSSISATAPQASKPLSSELSKQSGTAIEPGLSATMPSQNLSTNEDDWDDMYV